MRKDGRLAATDLSNHVACGHLTSLTLAQHAGDIPGGYTNYDPLLEILRERGRVHENAYVSHLKASGRQVEVGGTKTLPSMEAGVEVITQAELVSEKWFGRADFLVRVERPSASWGWSYEVIDTKLSTETRAATVLQLCVYSELLATLQGVDPTEMHVVKPGAEFPKESFDYAEYGAIYRALRADLEAHAAGSRSISTYPEPTAHCDVCNWKTRCDKQRRDDDHLSFVADLGRTHQRELERHDIRTLSTLATSPATWPHKPERGSPSTYERLIQQARLQHVARGQAVPPHELLPVEPERGLARLPEPSTGDIFLDFEGDPFIGDHGREYLFGWHTADRGYECIWTTDDTSERKALETFIAFVMARWVANPGVHVYHYAPYEPTALKRLVGRYAVCSDELDQMLRGRRLIDLYSIVRQTARIGVESYSIKYLEPLIDYTRPVALATTGPLVHAVKLSLQRGLVDAIEPSWKEATEAYNRGDCESAEVLRRWLEQRRTELIGTGSEIARPPLLSGERESITEVRTTAAVTAVRLLDGLSDNRHERSDPQQAQWLLGHMMEWYRREQAVGWWEFFRLGERTDDQRIDEQRALSGLVHVERIVGAARTVPIDRYRFPPQDVFLRPGDDLHVDNDPKHKLGSVVAIDPAAGFVDVKKTRKTLDEHPVSFFAHKVIGPKPKDAALVDLGTSVADFGFPPPERTSLVRDLLMRAVPRGLGRAGAPLRRADESIEACALRLANMLDGTVLPIQGPPGTGKTSTAARMIVELVRSGKRVGVTATSHSVIENLVGRTAKLARTLGVPLRAALRRDEPDEARSDGVEYIDEAQEAASRTGELDVLGATCWQWARPDMRASVDVLFIDEAGQLCLADALSVASAAGSMVLVGDPQQLEQPMQGTHPDGVAVSVLQHIIGSAPTIEPDRGLLLDQTYRLHPSIARFTSEQFYAGRLGHAPSVSLQGLATSPLTIPGLYWHPVEHRGNQNRSIEEAEAVAALIARCLVPGAMWTDSKGHAEPLTQRDVLVVAPFNAHLAAVRDALGARGLAGVMVGTVDKFQGREAAIAIYSMATSRPEDAPRGLSFLYDRHRLNVATSRARCASVLVASPLLLRPVCSTPQHLHLVSAMARFVELAMPVTSVRRA